MAWLGPGGYVTPRIDDQAPLVAHRVADFLVPAKRIWDDVAFTCGHQRIFCSEECVRTWLERTGNQRRYVMELPTLWRFASDRYAG